MTGLNKFSDKDRRRQRLHNYVARDLASPKYHQRVIPDKKRNHIYEDDEDNDSTDYLRDISE